MATLTIAAHPARLFFLVDELFERERNGEQFDLVIDGFPIHAAYRHDVYLHVLTNGMKNTNVVFKSEDEALLVWIRMKL